MKDGQIAGAACSGGSRAGRVFRGAVEVADSVRGNRGNAENLVSPRWPKE